VDVWATAPLASDAANISATTTAPKTVAAVNTVDRPEGDGPNTMNSSPSMTAATSMVAFRLPMNLVNEFG
jgi:hypothetical protein